MQGITISALYSDNKTQTDAQGNFSLMINDWDKPVFTDKGYDFTIVDSDEDNGFLNVIARQKKSNDKMKLFLGGAKAVGIKIEQKEAQRPGMLFIWDFFN